MPKYLRVVYFLLMMAMACFFVFSIYGGLVILITDFSSLSISSIIGHSFVVLIATIATTVTTIEAFLVLRKKKTENK